jgi:hypothetical protein
VSFHARLLSITAASSGNPDRFPSGLTEKRLTDFNRCRSL